jgi:oligosaccharyltransferase complex subunit alpha (ribophorin I)
VREVEVSHWGNIAVEEVYELQHAGAKLKGGFSRFEYMMRRADDGPSFRTIRAILPAKAENLYYRCVKIGDDAHSMTHKIGRDQIGNISTSDIAWNDDALELELSTRFPLFGGWKTQFYIGYSVPTTLFLYRNESMFHRFPALKASSLFHRSALQPEV